jgi:hypothetical protein
MTLLLLSLVSLVVLLAARAFYHGETIRREWAFISSSWSVTILEGLEIKAASESAALKSAYRSAVRARADGSRDEALRMLDIFLRMVERSAPDWLEVLASVILLSRMADAVTPIPPFKPWTYRLFPVTWLALVGMILHHVTITTGERLRLRAYILRGCWRIIRRSMRASVTRIRLVDQARAWERLDAARSDLENVSAETLRSVHAALLSLDARPTAAVAQAAGR